MESRGPKKPRRYKKRKVNTQEKLIKKFPYRLCLLTEPDPASPRKAKSNSLKDQLPLQKKLVPTRSIPLPGVGASDATPQSSSQSRHPPLYRPWEIKLLSLRFPKLDLDKLFPLKASADHPYIIETSGPSKNVS